jgi:hypothetical protein
LEAGLHSTPPAWTLIVVKLELYLSHKNPDLICPFVFASTLQSKLFFLTSEAPYKTIKVPVGYLLDVGGMAGHIVVHVN